MSTDFNPSLVEGQALDLAIRDSFSKSMEWCHDYLGNYLKDLFSINQLKLRAATPAQIGFYYSLSTILAQMSESDLPNNLSDLSYYFDGAAGLHSLDSAPLSGFDQIHLTTLSNNYYTDDEISCFLKWFDIEPEQTISLTGLSAQEMNLGVAKLVKALSFIKTFMPMFYDELSAITREIILAKPSGHEKLYFGGVSSFALWGAICLNANHHDDWKSYVPSLIHEYSHNVLFAKAMSGPLVENASTDLYHSPLRDSLRPMDGIYHAAFVSAREVMAAMTAYRHPKAQSINDEDPEMMPFLQKMVQVSLSSFQECTDVIESHGKLTEIGCAILNNTKQAINDSLAQVDFKLS